MKSVLFILLLIYCSNGFSQINQKTVALRNEYTKSSVYKLKTTGLVIKQTPIYNSSTVSYSQPIRTNMLTPSKHSIEKAFQYYNTKKQPDYSGFLILGYSLLSKQQFIIANDAQETVRFFPANSKD